jgi:hypothetical protein
VNFLELVCRKLGQPRKSKKNEMTREAVKNFLEREDNSSILTGKKDTKTENTDKKQKLVPFFFLTDSSGFLEHLPPRDIKALSLSAKF